MFSELMLTHLPQQANRDAGFRHSFCGAADHDSTRLLDGWGYVARNPLAIDAGSNNRAPAHSRRPAWESDHGLKMQNLASMVFILGFGNYPVFNGLVRSLS
jgi:hypothetical protein